MTYTQNDYTPLENLVRKYEVDGTFAKSQWQKEARVSVIVTTYNQPEQLRKQLLALSQQTYNHDSIEVVIADDGSKKGTGSCMDLVAKMELPFDVKYVWQSDKGFRLAKSRNEALKKASYETVISIDADMIMSHDYVEKVMKWHYASQNAGMPLMTTQDRAFVEPTDMNEDYIKRRELHKVKRSVSRRFKRDKDWRHKDRYAETNRLERIPNDVEDPTYFVGSTISGGNCSFTRSAAFEAGLFDESFQKYGAEDTEFGVRMYEHYNVKLRKKMYFVPVDTIAYHLEHGGPVSDKDSEEISCFFWDKVKKARERKVLPTPEVSVYVPCYNQERFVAKAVESIAKQKNFDLSKLEIVIGEDGSTDRSVQIIRQLQQKYAGRLNLRMIGDGKNRGLAENTNRTIQSCRGKYIMQLDADDELLETAVSTLYSTLERSPDASLAFGDCLDRDVKTGQVKAHWSCNEFTPEWYRNNHKATTPDLVKIVREGMRIHHPRMFRRESYFKTEGVNSDLQNAVDYDLYSKLIEAGKPIHVKAPLAIYNINHGENTTNKGRLQAANDKVVKHYTDRRNTNSCKRKEFYDIDENNNRVRHLDYQQPRARQELLYSTWATEENQQKGTKLYSALISELENVVSFFRWCKPNESEEALKLLLQLEPESHLGRYFQATFLDSRGKKTEALRVLQRVNTPSARRLEDIILQQGGIKATA
jgi:chondroitin synthase